MKLKNHVAIVTGASKGIGAAIAKSLAAAGASVVVNYSSSKEGAEKVVNEIIAAGGKATAIHANLSKKSDIDALFAATKKAYNRLDILVNNAGVYAFGPLESVTEESFHTQFNLNVLGLLLASQKAAETFGDNGGNIINISSVAGVVPPPNASIYSATKGAVDALTKSLAKELGPKKIRVNAINPGMIETEGVHTAGFLGSDFHKNIVATTPLGRIGQPADIGPIAVFLASSDSAWITGQTLLASGGQQ